MCCAAIHCALSFWLLLLMVSKAWHTRMASINIVAEMTVLVVFDVLLVSDLRMSTCTAGAHIVFVPSTSESAPEMLK